MQKVLLCAPYGGIPGGISRWTEHIINYYNSLETKRVNLYLAPMGRNTFVTNSSLIVRIKSGVVEFTKILIGYFKLVKSLSPEVVHVATSASISLLKDIVILRYARYKKAKTIIHFHFGRIPELFIKNDWEWKLLKKVLSLADVAIVMDYLSYDTLIEAGFLCVKILPNPVAKHVSKIAEDNKVINRIDRNLLFVGWVIKQKGVFELVDACCKIPGIRLKLVGHVIPEIKEELLELSLRDTKDPWLEIAGETKYEDVIKEMLSAGIFILPSYTEGFPNVILESMTCGCPIIATSVGAIPEMLSEDSGVLVEPGNVEMLKEAINFLLNDRTLANIYGENAKKRVKDNYSIPIVWEKLEDIWLQN